MNKEDEKLLNYLITRVESLHEKMDENSADIASLKTASKIWGSVTGGVWGLITGAIAGIATVFMSKGGHQ